MKDLQRRIHGLEHAATPDGGLVLVVEGAPMPAEFAGRRIVIISTGVPRSEREPMERQHGN
jgi:hypothetical protein